MGTWTLVAGDLTLPSVKVTKIIKGHEYIFRVRAENKNGLGPALESEAVSAVDNFKKSSAPLNLETSTVTSDSVVLSWQRPADDGNSDIDMYYIQKREKQGIRWVKACKRGVSSLHQKII